MSLVIGLIVLAGALLLLRSARRTHVTARQLERAERYLMQRDLPTDPELVVLTMRLQAVPDRAGRQMCGIAMSIGAVGLALLPYLPGGAWPAIGGPLLIMLCVPVFAVLYARGVSRHVPRAGGPHVAHAARPRITDYVPPLLWWWPLVSVAIAGVPAADYAVHPPVVASVPASVVVAAWAFAALAEATIMALVCWLAGRPPRRTSWRCATRSPATCSAGCSPSRWPVGRCSGPATTRWRP